MEIELRKRQNRLVDAGVGVILFAIWSVAKVNLYLGLSMFPIDQLYETADQAGINEKFFLAFMITIVAAILLWQLSTRLYIGLAAVAEGKGKKKGWGYLVLTAVLLIIDIQTSWENFIVERILAGEGLSVNLITGICMEAAAVYAMLELLISGIIVKKLRRQMKV